MTWPNLPKWLIPAIGYGVSAISLVWVLSKFPYAQLVEHLRTMSWTWVAVAIIFEIAIYFVDAWRWAALLQPVGAPPFRKCLQAVYVGLFANDVLPAKAGELIRCFLLSYETRVPISLALTSDLILRIMDGAWIVILYMLITLQIATHVVVSRIMWGFSAAVVVISVVVLFVLFRRQHAHHFVRNTSWAARFIHLLEEIHRLGHWRELRTAMWVSGLYWLTQVLAIWALTRADKFDLGVSGAAFLLVVKAVGTLVPNAPANVGAYQATTMYALGLLLVERPNAQIFSEIMFWFLTLPGLIGGAIAVGFAGLDFTDLHRHAKSAKELKNAHTR
jgi:glycosyltransferase 2 family protein